MKALTSPCTSGASSSTAFQRRPARSTRLSVRAGVWMPPSPHGPSSQQLGSASRGLVLPKGGDRPWIEASGQPMLAPRTQDMAGDPFGLLLRQRIIFLGGEVEDFGADAIVSQLLLLDNQDQTKDIKMFINSPGGSVTAGMGIYDAMMLCRADVQTYCFGLAASMGAFLLGAGKRGKRHSMPNSRIMIHQPLGGASGQAVDIEIQAKEIMYHKANLNRIMADYTNQPLSKIEEDTDRDRYMSPLEAKEYGIIDHIIGGEEAVFKVVGSNKRFPAVKDKFVTDESDLAKRSVLDGDSFMDAGGPSWRFRSKEVEPYMQSQRPGKPWFTVKKVSKEEYGDLVEKKREANKRAALSDESSASKAPKRATPKERMDAAWYDEEVKRPSS